MKYSNDKIRLCGFHHESIPIDGLIAIIYILFVHGV